MIRFPNDQGYVTFTNLINLEHEALIVLVKAIVILIVILGKEDCDRSWGLRLRELQAE